MRVTSLPAALSIAAVIAALALLVRPSSAGAERWLRPIPGEVTRSFHYSPAAPFTPGAHRGVDLGGAPGTPVRAACGGRVVHAGPVPGGAIAVSVRCGARRVSHLPLRRAVVRAGVRVRAGAALGTLAAGHGGLHLGVRADDDPFAYEDPLALLPHRRSPAPPVPAAPRPAAPRADPPALRVAPPVPHVAPPAPQVARPLPRVAPPAPGAAPVPLAPPLAWAGLALAATAIAGTGAVARRGPGPPECVELAAGSTSLPRRLWRST